MAVRGMPIFATEIVFFAFSEYPDVTYKNGKYRKLSHVRWPGRCRHGSIYETQSAICVSHRTLPGKKFDLDKGRGAFPNIGRLGRSWWTSIDIGWVDGRDSEHSDISR